MIQERIAELGELLDEKLSHFVVVSLSIFVVIDKKILEYKV